MNYYTCPECSRPVSPWEPTPCTNCQFAAEREAAREWAEDYQ